MIRLCRSLLRSAWRHPGRVLLVLALLGLGGVFGVPHLLAAYHFRAAARASDHHRLAEASRHLRPCLSTWPDSPRVRLLAARVARRSGDLAQAEEHLRECERLEH